MIKIIENIEEFFKKIAVRGDMTTGEYAETVQNIVSDVRENGDEALLKYIQKWESPTINLTNICLKKADLKKYFDNLEKDLQDTLLLATKRITEYHQAQLKTTWLQTKPNGEILGALLRPIETVGIYVPGGKASYPSSVLMNALPAHVAGVQKIIMATPFTNVNPTVLAAAYIAGVDEVYSMGGAQAIAAMAYGTKTIPRVDKIVGPGNIYVALAKRIVYGQVAIDSIAGPSEILVLADETANPQYIAADLLSQAEHDELASAILVTTSRELAINVIKEVENLSKKLTRNAIFEKSLKDFSGIIIVNDIEEAISMANKLAPEHLEIITKEPFAIMPKIKNAGALFLGEYTPEPLGDYLAGPNHVLPTGGTARFFSPLSVDDFIKKTSILSFSYEAFSELQPSIVKFAQAEGFTAHALSAAIRSEKK